VESKKSITSQKSAIGLSYNVVLNEDFFKDVEVSKDKQDVDSPYVHVEYLYTEAGVVEHFFSHFNNKSRFRDVVST